MMRQPIVSVLGHVDHGKTTILDRIRGTVVQKREVGGITQHIGATEVPIETIKSLCKGIKGNISLKIPGLLFIDTPGHEAFSSLRERGGSISDLAVLVIDVNEGIMPQTEESIKILKINKVPFIIAANKIDLVPGWRKTGLMCYTDSLKEQSENSKRFLDEKIYKILWQISSMGFDSDLFNRADFTKQIAVVPTSGVTGEGIPEMLTVLSGMSQKYLEENLQLQENGPAKGSVIEVKEEKGIGKTIDVILYDGSLEVGDKIVVGALPSPVVTKVKALLKPKALSELREKGNFQHIKKVFAACGVKVVANELHNVIAGMPLVEAMHAEEAIKSMEAELKKIVFQRETTGVIVKADSLGSLEAMTKILNNEGIPVKKAEIGDINKEDVIEANSVKEKSQFHGVIMAFNVKENPIAGEMVSSRGINVFKSNIIYRIIEEYKEWVKREEERQKKQEMMSVTLPCKIQILPNFVFRQSKPAIVGIEVLEGTMKKGYVVMDKQGDIVGKVVDIQDSGKRMDSAGRGERVAVSIDGGFFGKNINGEDTLYTDISTEDYNKLISHKDILTNAEMDILTEITKIKRKKNSLWGI